MRGRPEKGSPRWRARPARSLRGRPYWPASDARDEPRVGARPTRILGAGGERRGMSRIRLSSAGSYSGQPGEPNVAVYEPGRRKPARSFCGAAGDPAAPQWPHRAMVALPRQAKASSLRGLPAGGSGRPPGVVDMARARENEGEAAKSARNPAADIIAATDRLCALHLDAEYADLCRKLVAKLARKRPSPLARGEARVWAGAVLYTIAWVNFLFDQTQRPHWTSDELARASGVGKSTLSARATLIRKALGIVPLDPEFCRRSRASGGPPPRVDDHGRRDSHRCPPASAGSAGRAPTTRLDSRPDVRDRRCE